MHETIKTYTMSIAMPPKKSFIASMSIQSTVYKFDGI